MEKILLIEMSPFPYHLGGGYAHLCILAKGLIERGYEVHILSSNPSEEYKILGYPEGIILHNVGMKHKMFGKGNKFFSYIYRILYEISFVAFAMEEIKRINPDVINTQSLITTSLPCSLLHKPFIATQHGVYMKGFKELWKKRGRKDIQITGMFYALLERFNLRYCKEVIGVNKSVVEYYERYKPSVFIGNSIDISSFDNINIERKRNRYLFLGRVSEEKGLDYLMEAINLLDKKIYQKLEFIIAGSGEEDYIGELKAKLNDLKNINVKFIGPIYNEEKIKLFKSSAVFVLPSRFESFGIVLLEAMASGCAIISSDCSGPKEIVKKEFGLLVDYSEEENRVKKLTDTLLESLNWNINEMGEKAKEEVKQYDYKEEVEKYLEEYKNA